MRHPPLCAAPLAVRDSAGGALLGRGFLPDERKRTRRSVRRPHEDETLLLHFGRPTSIALSVARRSWSCWYFFTLAWYEASFFVQTRVYGLPCRSVLQLMSHLSWRMLSSRRRRRPSTAEKRCTRSLGSSRKRFSSRQSPQLHEAAAGRRKSVGGRGASAARARSQRRKRRSGC